MKNTNVALIILDNLYMKMLKAQQFYLSGIPSMGSKKQNIMKSRTFLTYDNNDKSIPNNVLAI